MGNDIDWIKQALKNITPKIEVMHTTFIQGEGKIKIINKEIYGSENSEGLKKKVRCLESERDKAKGWIGALIFIGSCLGAAIGFGMKYLINFISKFGG